MLTPHEEAEFAALPRERMPGRMLEERTVRTLRARGLLHRTPSRASWIATAAAAAVALFVTGFASGQWATSRRANTAILESQRLTAMQAAQMVQQTGSAYVMAIEVLAQMQDSMGGQSVEQGREAALASLYAAAGELGSLAPNDPVAVQIRRLLEGLRRGTDESEQETRSVVWF